MSTCVASNSLEPDDAKVSRPVPRGESDSNATDLPDFWQGSKLIDQYEGKASPEEYQLWLASKAKQPAQSRDEEANA